MLLFCTIEIKEIDQKIIKSLQIRDILNKEISQSAIFRLQICLKLITHLDNEIESLEK